MKRFTGFTLIVALLMVTTILAVIPVQASSMTQPGCSVASLQGSYRFIAPATIAVGQGTMIAVPDAYLAASPAAVASEGTVTFDGSGEAALEVSADRAGKLTSAVSYKGSYTMDTNCDATVTFDNQTSFVVKLIQSGSRQQVVSVTPGFVLTTMK
ncbi:MAG: hypothetical protein U0175_28660 [Caldilineaceae bacterium]